MNKLFFLCIGLIVSLAGMEPAKQGEQCSIEAETIIDGLNIVIPHYNPIIKIMTYNVDAAHREEQFEATKWINRAPRVKKLIDEVDADIVCLQELRDIVGSIPVNRFLGQFDQYRYVIAYRNPSIAGPDAPLETAFAQVTFYDPKKFFPLQSFPKWLSDTPDRVSDTWAFNKAKARGSIVLCTQFVLTHRGRVVQNVSPFWVFNVHFEIAEDVKTRSSHKLLEIIKKVSQGQPYIVCGDFNLFPTNFLSTAQGGQQRAILTEVMQDLGKNAQTLSGKPLEGTFIGYEHDQFKASLNEIITRADHIFGSKGIEKIDSAILYTKTMLAKEPEELKTRDYPSDHLPLIVDVKLFGK
jgi:endonuclease/exonuclease/phosphatase family metal-dependent hydrolase